MLNKIKRASLIFVVASGAILLSSNVINNVSPTEVKGNSISSKYDPIWPSAEIKSNSTASYNDPIWP